MKAWYRALGIALILAACAEKTTEPPPQEPPPEEPPPPPEEQVTVVMAGAGNIAKCTNDRDEATAQLLDAVADWVFALGDNVRDQSSIADYNNCYEPTWGRHKARTFVTLGNHDYDDAGAAGSFDYFGDRAGPRDQGYYSQNVGSWHIIVLNSNIDHVPVAAGSPQDQWLVADLAANTQPCILAMWHHPLFISGPQGSGQVRSSVRILWERLYGAGADIVLGAQGHHYERMAPMDPGGSLDPERGIRQFNVGTGGEVVSPPAVAFPNSEVAAAFYGVLKLTLRPDGYDWEFLSVPGESFSDTGSGTCH
jgi:3',5'-cyclic AMP phosphodiesterase CpdA